MEKLKLNIIANGMNGEGIAKCDGKVFFVDDAVVGDEIFAEVVKENKNFANAKVAETLTKSPHRCTPKCEHYGTCGGCNLQHINYEKTLEIKTQNVQNLFDKQKLNQTVEYCEKSDNVYGYRNKLTMYLTNEKSLGFYKKNSKQLININYCYLASEKCNNLINKLNIFIKNNNEFSPFVLKGLSIRELENNLFVLNLILTKKISLEKLENYLKLNKIKYSLYYCINAEKNSNLPTSNCFFVGGEQNVKINENGIIYPYHPLAFLQINNSVKQKIYNQIVEFVGTSNVVLDAYSGAGLLSAMVAKNSKMVYAIEIEKEASTACENLIKINKIKNLKAICGDCANEVPKLLNQTKIDIAILDPARKGADTNTLNAIINAKPNKIIYLSCNPATLARDLRILCDGGYKIEFAKTYDMFPNTTEVETLCVLTRIKNDN